MTPTRLRTDEGESAVTVQYDRSTDDPLTVVVADAVATARGVDVTELETLHDAIDTDALERLFEPHADGARTRGSVTFEYQGCLVTVGADGEIRVET
ncbi:HalOD1 output domain-containing protein [Halopiger goleimassiliensis]|uniref:HalOD1 output domain-containing protein n=1 Tax=Halopiger goleimassiliensis TaxID=1293048 RepID=UPI0006779A12|nr:HalOD1 output domain-containing protein [Halopiger goleimassiliensis]